MTTRSVEIKCTSYIAQGAERRYRGLPLWEWYLGIVEKQYRDASNSRIALQARFSTNAYGWQRWVFDRLELEAGARIPELGCGPGLLWRENLSRVPEGWNVTLTDASPGMLGDAKSHLGADRRFCFRIVDAQELYPSRTASSTPW